MDAFQSCCLGCPNKQVVFWRAQHQGNAPSFGTPPPKNGQRPGDIERDLLQPCKPKHLLNKLYAHIRNTQTQHASTCVHTHLH